MDLILLGFPVFQIQNILGIGSSSQHLVVLGDVPWVALGDFGESRIMEVQTAMAAVYTDCMI